MAFAGRHLSIASTLIIIAMSLATFAQDYAREKRWADEVIPAVVVGDPVWLALSGGHKFLNLLAEADGAKAAIV